VSKTAPADELRLTVQHLVRALGLLQVRRTPCGQPLPVSQAHTLLFMLSRSAGAGPPTQADLARHLGLDKSTITRLVRRMVDRDLLAVTASPTDGRARCLQLTGGGRRRAAEVDRASRALFDRVLGHLPAGRRPGVVTTLVELTAAVRQSQEEPAS